MKLMDPAKETLLDDLMLDRASPADVTPDADEVVALVLRAKRNRSRQRAQWIISAACLAFGCALTFAILTNRGRTIDFQQASRAVSKKMSTAEETATAPALPIERLDDEGLLELLDATPSALVEWADGRQELLLVVGSATAVPN